MPTPREFDISVRSEEVQEILSFIPHWIIRWGITVILLTVAMLLVGSYYVKYPDIINTRITITTDNPPAKLVSRSSGELILFVGDDEQVKAGQLVGMIKNPANNEDVFALEKDLEQFEQIINQPDSLVQFRIDSNYVLGELQGDYSTFLQAFLAYRFFVEQHYHQDKVQALQKQIQFYKQLNWKLKKQQEILAEELEITKSNYEKDQQLYEQKAIAQVALEQSKAMYLQKKFDMENAGINIIRNEIQIKEYEKNIQDLEQQFRESGRSNLISMQETFKRLKSQVDIWEERYLFISPFDGQVSFFKFWSNNQFVNTGEHVMIVLPPEKDLVGKVYMMGFGAGKVQEGQKVRIKFDGYPFNEFGAVEGRVASVSKVSQDNMILINVALPNGLRTNYNRTLEFRQQMQGAADIVTDELRLIERIFHNLMNIFEQSQQKAPAPAPQTGA